MFVGICTSGGVGGFGIYEEWVTIEADSLEDAIEKYPKAFFDWQVSQGLAKPGDWYDE